MSVSIKQGAPLVSVIIPAYNAEKTIKRAISSVIRQDYKNIEIIVVDDCSMDGTYHVASQIKDDRLHILRNSVNQERSRARNTGADFAHGDFIAFLDADDEFLVNKISIQLRSLLADSDAGGVISGYLYNNSHTLKPVRLNVNGDLFLDLLMDSFSLGSGANFFLRADVFKNVVGFNTDLKRNEDIEFMLRLLEICKITVIPEPLFIVHGHASEVIPAELLLAKKHFMQRFKSYIDRLSPKMQSKIYSKHWLQLARYYSLDGDIKGTVKYLLMSLKYGVIFSKITKILPKETYFVMWYYLVRGILRKLLRK